MESSAKIHEYSLNYISEEQNCMSDDKESTIDRHRSLVEEAENRYGPNSFEFASALDQLAAALKTEKQVLEAVNLNARARLIRSKLGIPEPSSETEDDLSSPEMKKYHSSKKQGKLLLYSFLVLLFGIDWFLVSKFDFSTVIVAGFVTALAGIIIFMVMDAPLLVKTGIIFAWVAVLTSSVVPKLSNFGADYKLQQASLLHNQQRYKEAYALLDSIYDPPAKILRVRASCAFELGKYDETIHDCDLALKKNVNDGLAYYLRGTTYYVQEKFDKAVADLYKAVQVPSAEISVPLVKYRLGKSLVKSGRIEEGSQYLREAREGGVEAEPQ